MSLKKVFAIVAIAAAFVYPGQASAEQKPDTLYYQVKVKSSLGNEGTRQMYVKGSCFRFDYEAGDPKAGTLLKSTAIKNKDGAFLIPSSRRQIGKYPDNSPRQKPASYIPGPNGDVKAFLKSQNAKKGAAQTVSKKKCDTYTYKDKPSGATCKLVVDPKTMTPLQLNMTLDLAKGKKFHRTITYVTYKRGINIPDSKFELPKGIPVIPMPKQKQTPQPGH